VKNSNVADKRYASFRSVGVYLRRLGRKLLLEGISLVLITMVILLISSSAVRATTPAGTRIVNQGVILYEDEAGVSYTATSNQVIIEVLPVYGVSILPDGSAAAPGQSQDALADQRVYFPYTLTNTGNTDDSYLLIATLDGTSTFIPQLPDGNAGIEIFWDENMNGVADAGEPLVASWRDLDGDGLIDLEEVSNSDLGPLEQDEITGLMRSIRKLKPSAPDNFSVNQISMLSQGMKSIFSMINLGGWIIGGFSILVGGFGIANIMFVSVKERTRQIGIQKALGAKNSFILQQFLYESVILSLLGGIIGLLLVYAGLLVANHLLDMTITMTLNNILRGLGISAVIGILSGYTPARNASRLNPVEAIAETF